MSHHEYLLSYGLLGDFGRFFPTTALTCRRGQRAVVRSHRGLELATVLGDARPGHAAFLPNTSVGTLLRLATPDDETQASRRREQARRLVDEARTAATRLALPLEVLDAEVLLDGEHAVVHHVRWAEFDPRDLVSRLSTAFDWHIALLDLTAGKPAAEEGCGKPGCGQTTGGSCATSGGCSTCSLHNTADLKNYFAGLREKMPTAGHLGGTP